MNGSPLPQFELGPCLREDCTVIAPDILQNPSFKRWLGGVEPVWMLLDQASIAALRRPPRPTVGAIRLATDFSPDEIARSAVARNALILLHMASAGLGLKMTATGNLSRNVVAEMCDLFTWPGFDKAEAFRLHKVINEPDFLPLFFVRHIVETAGLVRPHKGYLKITPTGRPTDSSSESPSNVTTATSGRERTASSMPGNRTSSMNRPLPRNRAVSSNRPTRWVRFSPSPAMSMDRL